MHEATAVVAPANTSAAVRGYYELTKPGITAFVGMSAAAGYVISSGSPVNPVTLVLVLIATTTMSGGAAALNQVAERDIDAQMLRTMRRPLPAGVLTARSGATFGWLLSALGSAVALTTLPPLTFVFLAACHISYVYWYTPLKRRSELCTLVGAIPGALPVLAGAAAAGVPNAASLALTGLLFTWQIPHFMAIGWMARDDYARAGFVMMPVIDETGNRTARTALLYAIATQGLAVLVAREANISMWLVAAIHAAGTVYAIAALPFIRTRKKEQARRLFFASLVVLPVMLGAVLLDVALRS